MRVAHHAVIAATIALASCEDTNRTHDASSTSDLEAISLVDEVYGLSQGLETDGVILTVRGWLAFDSVSDEYQLYNTAWDVFEPTTKDGIRMLGLQFVDAPPEYWIGQYVNVRGRVVTEALAGGDRGVRLDPATLVSIKIHEGQTLPYRNENKPNKAEMATPRKPSD